MSKRLSQVVIYYKQSGYTETKNMVLICLQFLFIAL
jgi:hypothetical protein